MTGAEELYGLLSNLARRGAYAQKDGTGRAGEKYFWVYAARNEFTRPIASVAAVEVDQAVHRGLVCAGGEPKRWRLTSSGATLLRRRRARGGGEITKPAVERQTDRSMPAGRSEPHLQGDSGCRNFVTAPVPECPARLETYDLAESPLGWLRRRRGKDGRSLIDEAQFAAGERLRRDFSTGQFMASVTSDWSLLLPADRGRRAAPGIGVELGDRAMSAQNRVRRALEAVGPELSGVLVDVCCYLKGLEVTEKEAGWPQRSGKIVLTLSLSALARHYGLVAGEATAAGHQSGEDAKKRIIRHWGANNFRPSLDGDKAPFAND